MIILTGFVLVILNQKELQTIREVLTLLKNKPASIHLTQINIHHLSGNGHGFGEGNSITSIIS